MANPFRNPLTVPEQVARALTTPPDGAYDILLTEQREIWESGRCVNRISKKSIDAAGGEYKFGRYPDYV